MKSVTLYVLTAVVCLVFTGVVAAMVHDNTPPKPRFTPMPDTPTPSPVTPTATFTPMPNTPTPSSTSTFTPMPNTPTPTGTPEPEPTSTPTMEPTSTPTVDPTASPECVNHGDVNFDGVLTAGDALLAFNIALGIHNPTYEESCAADCNGNGVVTSGDAQIIFYASIGLGNCVDPIVP